MDSSPEQFEQNLTKDDKSIERQMFQTFLSMLKSVGFYPDNSPIRERAVEKFVALLKRDFSGPNGVALNLRPGEVFFGGERVLTSGEEDWDPVARLFESGLRDLTFLPGMCATEITALCKLLSRTIKGELNPTDEDLSVLLWEMDLPAIAYSVIDPGDEQSFFDVASSQTDEECEAVGSFGDWEGLHPLGRYLASSGGLDNSDIDSRSFRVSQVELATLRNAAKTESRYLEPKLVALFSELLLLDLSRIEFDRLVVLLHEYTLSLLEQGRFEVFIRMASRLGELVPQLNEEQAKDLGLLAGKFSNDEAIDKALAAVKADKCDNEEAAARFFGGFGFAGQIKIMNSLIPDLEQSTPPASSGILLRALARAVERKLDLFLEKPQLLKEEHFTLLARLLPEQVSAKMAEQLGRRLNSLLGVADPGVKIGVVKLISVANVPGLEKILQTCLEDDSPQVRMMATEILSQKFGAKSLQLLLQILLTDEFESREFEEQAFFYEALARSSPEEVFGFLERTISRRNWFAPAKWRIQKACALRALGMIPLEKAGPPLLKYRNSRDPFLAAASRTALERHRFKLHGTPDEKRRAV